jgi:hypothetical protein
MKTTAALTLYYRFYGTPTENIICQNVVEHIFKIYDRNILLIVDNAPFKGSKLVTVIPPGVASYEILHTGGKKFYSHHDLHKQIEKTFGPNITKFYWKVEPAKET